MAQFQTPTVRAILAHLHGYGPTIVVCAGANSPYGAQGRRISPDNLLATLAPLELARRGILTYDPPPSGYQRVPWEPVGWLHIYGDDGRLQEAPVLLIYEPESEAQT